MSPRLVRLLAMAVIGALLAACGNKGPLVRPDADTATTASAPVAMHTP